MLLGTLPILPDWPSTCLCLIQGSDRHIGLLYCLPLYPAIPCILIPSRFQGATNSQKQAKVGGGCHDARQAKPAGQQKKGASADSPNARVRLDLQRPTSTGSHASRKPGVNSTTLYPGGRGALATDLTGDRELDGRGELSHPTDERQSRSPQTTRFHIVSRVTLAAVSRPPHAPLLLCAVLPSYVGRMASPEIVNSRLPICRSDRPPPRGHIGRTRPRDVLKARYRKTNSRLREGYVFAIMFHHIRATSSSPLRVMQRFRLRR